MLVKKLNALVNFCAHAQLINNIDIKLRINLIDDFVIIINNDKNIKIDAFNCTITFNIQNKDIIIALKDILSIELLFNETI